MSKRHGLLLNIYNTLSVSIVHVRSTSFFVELLLPLLSFIQAIETT